MSALPEPHEIFARTREEGMRRLSRSRLELASTALVAGFDVIFGVIALGVIAAALTPRTGPEIGHMVGSLGFGIAFVFIVIGRSELFTENFLVPLAGLHRGGIAKRKLAELWILSPVLNILGGIALILIVTSHGALPPGTAKSLLHIANDFHHRSEVSLFLSAIAGGALITLMTWFVEAAGSVGGRIVVAWIAGALLTLGSFNHVIVVTLELIFGIRYGAHFDWLYVAQNFVVAALGNLIGGLLFVTLTRTGQAAGSGKDNRPSEG
ncbi:MAG: formate/nitrite transporter family protein [Solirubrobacteraceae bacterium]